jgi:hypothetical protein
MDGLVVVAGVNSELGTEVIMTEPPTVPLGATRITVSTKLGSTSGGGM